MSRRLWIIVAAVLGVFGAVSFVTASPTQVQKVLASVGTPVGSAVKGLERFGRSVPLPVALGIIGGAVALLLLVTLAAKIRRRRPRAGFGEPWRTVMEMGRQGRSASAIAQATGIPQDAVRIVLSPVAVDPSLSRGKSFRSNPPGDQPAPHRDGPGGSR